MDGDALTGAVLHGRGYWEWEVVRRHSVFSSVKLLPVVFCWFQKVAGRMIVGMLICSVRCTMSTGDRLYRRSAVLGKV